jgi:rubrerythrin
VADEVINRVIESQKDRIEEKKVAPKKKETVQEKQPPPEPQKPEVPADIQYMINELEDEDIELQCPKCGTFIKYKPGLDVCPACKEKVKFFAD